LCKILTSNEINIDPIQILHYVCEDDIIVDITTQVVIIVWPAVRHNATKFPDFFAISLPLWEHHSTTTVPHCKHLSLQEILVVLQCYVFVDYGLYLTSETAVSRMVMLKIPIRMLIL